MEIVKIKISDLTPYKNNAKKHPKEQIEQIKKSIVEFGMNDPIGVWGANNLIIEGHGRYQALKELGYTEVECIRLDHLTDEERRAYTLVHNKLTMNSDFDFDILDEELKDIAEFDVDLDMNFYGFDNPFEEEKEIFEDEVPEIDSKSEPITKLGDIWQLGNHRLMCGDSTNKDDVEKLMNGNKADMVFTDPPYGMKKEKYGVLNDNLNYDDLLKFNKKWIPLTFDNTKDNGSWYCWGIDEPLMDIYSQILKPMIKNKQIAFRNLITWDKGSGQGQLSEEFRMYPIADEKCLFVMIGGDSIQGFCVNADDYSEKMDKVRVYLEAEIKKLNQSDKVIANSLGYKDGRTVNHWWSKSQFALPTRENYEALRQYGKSVLKDNDFLKKDYDFLKKDYDELKKDYDELKKDFYSGRSYFDNTHDNMNNVWHFSKTSQKERELTGGHATPKPIALCSRAIKSSSRENEIVLDVFGGSGSTLIACEQLNRQCYMMEYEPHYVDVIIQRWEQLTGKEAKLIDCDGIYQC